jgi:tetratricopeptide (TPR) repeat protein
MPSHLHNAITENQRGHFKAALAHAEAAIQMQQDGVKPYLCAAFSAARLFGDEHSLEWVDRGLALEPGNLLALATRANLLESLHRAEAALEAGRQWAQVDPRSADARLCCARTCCSLHLFDSAIDAYSKAADLAPRPAAILTDLSILLFEMGRRDEASKMLDRALDADGNFAAAWYTRAEAKRFVATDPDIEILSRQLAMRAARPQALHESVLLHYALAKAHLDFDDHSKALVHLRAGSALKRSTLNYDATVDERFMTNMARTVTRSSLEKLRGAGTATRKPIFIVGMPRSGSSLLEQMLASHPSVLGGGESARMQSLIAKFGAGYPGCLESISREQLESLAVEYVGLLPAHGAVHITDKTPYNFLHLGLIHAMFPQACIIHCRRDPADTCLSIYSTWFAQGNEFSYDIPELTRFYRAYTQLMNHWRDIIPANLLLEVEYEKMVQDFSGESRRVLEFCGLDWTDAVLTFHETERAVHTASKHQVRKQLYASSVGRARRFPILGAQLQQALGSAAGAEPGEDS